MRMSGLSKVEMSAFIGGQGPMETERIALSQRERDRLRVLQEIRRKQITQRESARPLKISHQAARGKSFRPTASRTRHQCTFKSLQKCSSQPPLTDISIWQKTGHFYFALTEY